MRIVKDISKEDFLLYLFITGGLTLAVVNPLFITPAILLSKYYKKERINEKKFQVNFGYLKQHKLILVSKKGNNVNIRLTKKGLSKARNLSIEESFKSLESSGKSKWDGKWRLIMFDVSHDQRPKREAFRRMLKRVGFMQLQKSIWVYPFDCKKEVRFVKDVFRMKDSECRLVVSEDIGDDREFRHNFGL